MIHRELHAPVWPELGDDTILAEMRVGRLFRIMGGDALAGGACETPRKDERVSVSRRPYFDFSAFFFPTARLANDCAMMSFTRWQSSFEQA